MKKMKKNNKLKKTVSRFKNQLWFPTAFNFCLRVFITIISLFVDNSCLKYRNMLRFELHNNLFYFF